MCVCVSECVCVVFFLNLFNSMPHYTVILHALHNLSLFSSHFKSTNSIDLTNFAKKFT